MTGDGAPSTAARRQAVAAQLDALPEHEVRTFLAYLTALDVQAVELPLAQFLADLAPRAGGDGRQVLSSPGLAALGGYLASSQ